jgi:hypothetical protein
LNRNFVHIDYEAIKSIIKNSFLDFDIRLRLGDFVKGVFESSVSPREAIEDQEGGEKISTDGENGHRKKELIQTHSRGFESSDFTVAGKSSKGEEDCQKNCHWDGEDEERRGDKEKEHHNLRNVYPSGYNQFYQFENLIHQKDDCKDHEAYEKDGNNFFKDVEISGLFHGKLDAVILTCVEFRRITFLMYSKGGRKGCQPFDSPA